MEDRQINLKAKLSYGMGDIFGGGAFLLISLLYLNFLTDVEFIAPVIAGCIIMISKIWDAFVDPFIGTISDRTKSRFGRRRIFFLVGSLPILFTFSMMWFDFGITNSTSKIIYFLITYMLFSTCYSFVMVPYNSILPDMVSDYKARTSFSSIRMGFSVFSAMLSSILPSLIIHNFVADKKSAYLIMAIIFGTFYALCWVFVFFGTWERKDIQYVKPKESILRNFLSVFKNKSFRFQICMYLTGQGSVDILTTLFIYYLTYVLNKSKEYTFVLGVLMITQLLSFPFHTYISKKFGKTAPYKFGLPIWILAMIIAVFTTKDSPAFLIYLVSFLCGIGCASTSLVPYSILPDISDVDELITGQRREGLYSGMVTFIRKLVNGIIVGLIGVVLQLIGYNAHLSAGAAALSTINGIRYLFVFAPIVLMVLTLLIASRFKLSEHNHKVILQVINDRKEHGRASDSNLETIKICEQVTGMQYDKLWKGEGIPVAKN